MSRENKVNPGQYTQGGRLTPDETAREVKKQREISSPSRTEGNPHPFQATKRNEIDEDELDDARAVSSDETETGTREVNDEAQDVKRTD